jgi:lysyl endopeptidase
MTRLVLALLAAAIPSMALASTAGMPSRDAALPVASAAGFRAPHLSPIDLVSLPAPLEKAAPRAAGDPDGRKRVGEVRPLPKAARVAGWMPVNGGFVARLRASSEGAEGLRVKLELGDASGALEVRAQGSDGRIEVMAVDPALGSDAWTPWTEGPVQVIEVFSRSLPPLEAVRLGAVVHFTQSPLEKAAGTCTVSTMCAASDSSLASGVASAINNAKKAVAKLSFIDGGGSYVCSGTLINTEKFPAAYLLTANHCINNATSARSLSTIWFYESTACDGLAASAGRVQVAGGAQLVFANDNVDASLLLLNQQPPAGAVYLGWNPARLASAGDAIVSISHPDGDTSRYAIGATSRDYRIIGHPQDMYGVRFTRGIIEGGSSGSGLFTMANGALQLRGVLSGTTVANGASGMSCTNRDESALYGRLELLYPQITPYITLAGRAPDDAPNRVQDFAAVPLGLAGSDAPLDTHATTLAIDNRRLDYAGDLDTYRFTIASPSWVSVWTEGANLDTVGAILDSRGVFLESEDDAQAGDNHAGITRKLGPGTYYFQVGHFEAAGTGAYNVRMRADAVDTNYTDLWWNASESGWGLNVNHQGNIIFATLFTYDTNGAPLWLAMSDGERQPDGSYQGTLYRSSGPAFNAAPFGAASAAAVGTLRLTFTGRDSATLAYTVNGTPVAKSVTRQVFATAPTCTWSAFDRSVTYNFQDLWWNPAEPGWGVNLTHQGNTLFATLFTYDANGQGVWLVMSNGVQSAPGRFSGTLYQTAGPAFSAPAWNAPAQQAVGSLNFNFSNGNAGTMSYTYHGVAVTKSIQRQVFAPLKTKCES